MNHELIEQLGALTAAIQQQQQPAMHQGPQVLPPMAPQQPVGPSTNDFFHQLLQQRLKEKQAAHVEEVEPPAGPTMADVVAQLDHMTTVLSERQVQLEQALHTMLAHTNERVSAVHEQQGKMAQHLEAQDERLDEQNERMDSMLTALHKMADALTQLTSSTKEAPAQPPPSAPASTAEPVAVSAVQPCRCQQPTLTTETASGPVDESTLVEPDVDVVAQALFSRAQEASPTATPSGDDDNSSTQQTSALSLAPPLVGPDDVTTPDDARSRSMVDAITAAQTSDVSSTGKGKHRKSGGKKRKKATLAVGA